MTNKIDAELAALGYTGDHEEFKEVIGELHALMAPNFTDEDLADHLDDAKDFCRAVCRRVGAQLPDFIIMRTLRNMRKNCHRAAYSPYAQRR